MVGSAQRIQTWERQHDDRIVCTSVAMAAHREQRKANQNIVLVVLSSPFKSAHRLHEIAYKQTFTQLQAFCLAFIKILDVKLRSYKYNRFFDRLRRCISVGLCPLVSTEVGRLMAGHCDSRLFWMVFTPVHADPAPPAP